MRMSFSGWLEGVSLELKDDAVWSLEAYRLSLFLADLCWIDTQHLLATRKAFSLADQLVDAAGSIPANIAEGFSRQSGRDQARFYEYALGSAREARTRYFNCRSAWSDTVVEHRFKLLSQIIRLLLTMIPDRRGEVLREEPPAYNVALDDEAPLS